MRRRSRDEHTFQPSTLALIAYLRAAATELVDLPERIERV
jgi:hypothetical protein